MIPYSTNDLCSWSFQTVPILELLWFGEIGLTGEMAFLTFFSYFANLFFLYLR